jgi:hypothetical protein
LDWANAGEASIVTRANAMPVAVFVVISSLLSVLLSSKNQFLAARLDQIGRSSREKIADRGSTGAFRKINPYEAFPRQYRHEPVAMMIAVPAVIDHVRRFQMSTMLSADDGGMQVVDLRDIQTVHDSVLTCAAAVDCGLVVNQTKGETKMRLRTAFFTIVPG